MRCIVSIIIFSNCLFFITVIRYKQYVKIKAHYEGGS